MMAAGPRAKRPPQSWFDRSTEGGEPVMAIRWSARGKRKGRRPVVRAALGLLAIVIMLALLARPQVRAEGPMPAELKGFVASAAGKAAPAISVSDQAERSVDIQSFRGRVLLVNFWATWCEP